MLAASVFALPLLALPQAPGAGWVVAPAPPREVKRVYWELFETTEIWVRLDPAGPDRRAPLVSLLFQAFFPGRAQREPYSLLPRWPTRAPSRLVVRAEPFPLTAIRDLSLRLVIEDLLFDLTGPGTRHRLLPCGDDCSPNAVEAEVDPSLLRLLAVARTVGGQALGFPIQFTEADQRALREFIARVGLSAK